MPSFSRYIGITWKDKGRDLQGCDCWGLLRLVYQIDLGINLPSYGELYPTPHDAAAVSELISGELGPWLPVPQGTERMYDGILLMEAGVPRHIGVVVSPGQMLHMRPLQDSVIECYHSTRWSRRINGFFRHKDAP